MTEKTTENVIERLGKLRLQIDWINWNMATEPDPPTNPELEKIITEQAKINQQLMSSLQLLRHETATWMQENKKSQETVIKNLFSDIQSLRNDVEKMKMVPILLEMGKKENLKLVEKRKELEACMEFQRNFRERNNNN